MSFLRRIQIICFLPLGLLGLLFVVTACSPKVYQQTYSDRGFKPQEIKNLIIVAGDTKLVENYAFSEIFTQTANERQKFLLSHKDYIKKNELQKFSPAKNTDAFLVIALTHVNQGNLSPHLPTTIGANAKLVERNTGKMLWNTTYSYSSNETGYFAPPLEEVMKMVSHKLIDAVPLNQGKSSSVKTAATKSKIKKPGRDSKRSKNPPIAAVKKPAPVPQAKSKDGPYRKKPLVRSSKAHIVKRPPAAENVDDLRAAAYSIQVGVFHTKRTAENLVSILIKKGYAEAYLFSKADTSGKIWHTVRLGKYSRKTRAKIMAAGFSKRTKIDTAIRPYNTL